MRTVAGEGHTAPPCVAARVTAARLSVRTVPGIGSGTVARPAGAGAAISFCPFTPLANSGGHSAVGISYTWGKNNNNNNDHALRRGLTRLAWDWLEALPGVCVKHMCMYMRRIVQYAEEQAVDVAVLGSRGVGSFMRSMMSFAGLGECFDAR